jgi:DNA-binding MarR family transcriptional regulator
MGILAAYQRRYFHLSREVISTIKRFKSSDSPSISEKAQIIRYIRKRPKCTVDDISAGLQLQRELVCTILESLELKGLVIASRSDNGPRYAIL